MTAEERKRKRERDCARHRAKWALMTPEQKRAAWERKKARRVASGYKPPRNVSHEVNAYAVGKYTRCGYRWNAPADTAEEVRDLRKFIGVVAEDARDLGYYVSYSQDQDEQTNRRHDRQEGHVPLSPREIALAARLNNAEQIAKRLVEVNRRMRIAMQRAGISCDQFAAETASCA